MSDINEGHTWTFKNSSSLVSEKMLDEKIGFEDAFLRMDFSQSLNSDDIISTISSVTVTAITANTAPTVASSSIGSNKKSVELTVDTALATANNWTLTGTVTTTNGETIKRKGVLVLS